MKKLTIVLLMFVIVMFAIAYDIVVESGITKRESKMMIKYVKDYHQLVLKDPFSVAYQKFALFYDIESFGNYKIAHVAYRAKNSYGAYGIGDEYYFFVFKDSKILEVLTQDEYLKMRIENE